MIIYSLHVLLFLFGTSLLFHVQFCSFLTCIQISQEACQVVCDPHLFQNFPQFVVIYKVKGFGIVNKTEVDVFFSYCSWGSQGKNTEVVCHSLLRWTTFCQTSPPWPACLEWPHTAWLSFIGLDLAAVHMIRLASCLWLWFQSVCPLMSSLIAYHLTWFVLSWMWGISSRLLQQSAGTASYFGHGIAPPLVCCLQARLQQ